MRLLSVNVGRPTLLTTNSGARRTGIYKEPASGAVEITREGMAGDSVCDTRHHGGVDQAIYVYGVPDYDWWSKTLGRKLEPGTFGENLTITDFESATASVGDRFRIGRVVLEITAPRVPCGTLARRMNDKEFVTRFREAERPGVYCRVIGPGSVQAGDEVVFEPYRGETISVIESFRVFYAEDVDALLRRQRKLTPLASCVGVFTMACASNYGNMSPRFLVGVMAM